MDAFELRIKVCVRVSVPTSEPDLKSLDCRKERVPGLTALLTTSEDNGPVSSVLSVGCACASPVQRIYITFKTQPVWMALTVGLCRSGCLCSKGLQVRFI